MEGGRKSRPHKTGSDVQREILDYCRRHKYVNIDGFKHGDVVAYKVEVANERGVPDILVCAKGQFAGVECKGSDAVSEIQNAQLERISLAGGRPAVARTLQQFINLLKSIIYQQTQQSQ
jgi:hypothetical protein